MKKILITLICIASFSAILCAQTNSLLAKMAIPFLPSKKIKVEWFAKDRLLTNCVTLAHGPRTCPYDWSDYIKKTQWQLRIKSLYQYSDLVIVACQTPTKHLSSRHRLTRFRAVESIKGKRLKNVNLIYHSHRGLFTTEVSVIKTIDIINVPLLLFIKSKEIPNVPNHQPFDWEKVPTSLATISLILFPKSPYYGFKEWDELLEKILDNDLQPLNSIDAYFMSRPIWK